MREAVREEIRGIRGKRTAKEMPYNKRSKNN
jgi:hypothetical protein